MINCTENFSLSDEINREFVENVLKISNCLDSGYYNQKDNKLIAEYRAKIVLSDIFS
jgi:hypothetical protein